MEESIVLDCEAKLVVVYVIENAVRKLENTVVPRDTVIDELRAVASEKLLDQKT